MDLNDSDYRDQECTICTEKFNNPAKLPCGHIFCFLCVKAQYGKGFPTCALCRAEILPEFLDDPVLVKQTFDDIKEFEQDSQWYYGGKDGWWEYDPKSSIELEKALNAGVPECPLTIGADDYLVNFQIMMQMRKGDRTRRRRVHRGIPILPVKGVSGIKNKERQLEEIVTENEFNEADTISLYTDNNEAKPLETDHHEMFQDFFYSDIDD